MDEQAQNLIELNGKMERMMDGIESVKEKQNEQGTGHILSRLHASRCLGVLGDKNSQRNMAIKPSLSKTVGAFLRLASGITVSLP